MPYKDKDKQREYQKLRIRRIVRENKEMALDYLSRGCVVCGEDFPGCLDFHHTDPGKKEFGVSRILHHSSGSVMKEVSKCVVLCANCHRKLHAGYISL